MTTPALPSPDGPQPALATAVDATAGRAAALALGLASFVRRRRIFHPYGAAFEALLTVEPVRTHGAALLDDPTTRPCAVRLSRGIGLPDGTQDVLGIAVRVLDDQGAIHQDLLFATVAGHGAAARHVLAPSPSFGHRPFSTILPYRTRQSMVVLTMHAREPAARGLGTLEASAHAFEAGDLTFELRATEPGADGAAVGWLRASRRLSGEQSEDLCFNPFRAADDLQPAGTLNALRRRAYAASQAARPRGGGWSGRPARS